MKHLFFAISIVLLGLSMFAQEVQFPSAIISAGGGSSSENNSINITHWQLTQVHVITLPEELIKEIDLDNKVDWEVTLYPNPAINLLNLEITPSDTGQIVIELYNSTGKKMLVEKHAMQPVIQIEVSEMLPGAYLLRAFSPSNEMLYTTKKVIKK